MKHGLKRKLGFTLIELLVVIAIIAILAGILLPTLAIAKKRATVSKAKIEIRNLVGAIEQYQSTYGRYPTSKETRTKGIDANSQEFVDFTYGTFKAGKAGANSVVNKAGDVTTISNRKPGYDTNNSEVMAILMDVKEWTLKQKGNPENPQHQSFWNPKQVDSDQSPGLGRDGVMRDAWGNPYIISFDMNYDGQTRDAAYGNETMATDGAPAKKGLNGLFKAVPAIPNSWESRNGVMIWSLGPDGVADMGEAGNGKKNKDNVLSWGN